MATNPTLLAMPLAENGTKNVIPATQATAGDGLFSQSTGFPAETSLPLGAGGVAPSREDFNGMANLLGGIAFMAQKGFTFNYDATQDYYAGCVVIDGGNRYLCIADMAAGTVAPSADTTHDYWIFYPVGVINKRDVITTSGTYIAPVTGWYKISVKGGGGGGAGGSSRNAANNNVTGGGGGGEGGTTIAFEYMTAGQTASVVIGAGGTGGAVSASGTAGGNSTVTVGINTYTGGGGDAGSAYGAPGQGGTGTICGACGCHSDTSYTSVSFSTQFTSGGGNGAKISADSVDGGGGCGGFGAYGASPHAGYAGGNGFAWFEYFAAV